MYDSELLWQDHLITDHELILTNLISYYKYVSALVNGILKNLKAISNEMKMISDNTMHHNFSLAISDSSQSWSEENVTQDALEQKAIDFNCLSDTVTEVSLYHHYLSDKVFLNANCLNEFHFEILFFICWNSKDLASSDFKSHVVYSDAGLGDGNCLSGFDYVINQIFLETYYDFVVFKCKNDFFIFTNNDSTDMSLISFYISLLFLFCESTWHFAHRLWWTWWCLHHLRRRHSCSHN